MQPEGRSPTRPVTDAAVVEHGGDLTEASARFGAPPDGWLDLSTGINAEPWPLPRLDPRVWHRLPQATAEAGLRAAAAEAYGSDPAEVLPLAGSQQALALLPLLFGGREAVVLGPTYGEYATRWQAASGHVTEVGSLADLATGLADGRVGFVCNPNNPDGRRLAPDTLLALAGEVRNGGLLVVDEAFADTTPELSVCDGIRGRRMLVLRSFGKFFGLAGMRLGFAVGDADLLAPLGSLVGPWAVSGPALAIGAAALADRDWIAAARASLAARRARLDAILARAGYAVAGGTDMFALIESPEARALHERLARRGVWTRAFSAWPDRLRLGIPATGEFGRLESALAG